MFQYLFLLSLLLASCKCAPSATKSSADTIDIAVSSTPESLDPRFATSFVAGNISQLICSSLFRVGDDLQVTPFLAKGYRQINDLTYEIELRDGLYFHDGTPITSHDVVYTISTLSSDDVKSSIGAKLTYLDQVQAVDDRVVRFYLNKPFAPVLMDLGTIAIVSQKQCEGKTAQCRQKPICSGPFRLDSFDQATETIMLSAHPQWFEGMPKIPKIRIRVVRDNTTRLLELIKGKTDLVNMNVVPLQLETLRERAPHINISQLPGLGYAYIGMNLRGPREPGKEPESEQDRSRRALADLRVRQAFSYGIDTGPIIHTKFHNFARRASGMLPDGHWAKSPDLQAPQYDIEKAKRLLDEAGFGDRGKMGRFTLNLNVSPDRFLQSVGLVFADAFKKLGVKVVLHVKEWSALYEDIQQGNFEMFTATWTPVVEPDLMYWVFHSDNIPAPGKPGGNRGGYINKEVDQLIDAARTQTDPKERAKIYQQIERQLLIDMPYIPLWFEDKIAIQNQRLKNYRQDRIGSLLGLRHANLGESL